MSIVEEAKATVDARRKEYGEPGTNLEQIASLWRDLFRDGRELSATDVCLAMILVKVARQSGQGYHRDTIMDIIGYAYIIALLNGETDDVKDERVVLPPEGIR